MAELEERLKKKGWSEKEIRRVKDILRKVRRSDRLRMIPHMQKLLFWSIFCLMLIGNFLLAVLLIPFLLLINRLFFDIIIVIIGLSFGTLFAFVVHDLEQLSKHHHLFMGLAIPFIAFINIFVIYGIALKLSTFFGFPILRENPIVISIIYAAAFVTPYLILFARKKIKI